MLQELHPHIRDGRITFNEKDHVYKVDQSEDVYISVTTLIKSFFPKFDADRVIDKLMKHPVKWMHNKYYGKSKEEIKREWKQKGDESSRLGTLLHRTIEHYYNNVEQEIPKEIHQEFLLFKEFHNSISESLKPYRTEWCIFDEDFHVAGSIDMVYTDEYGKYHMYDWKRTLELKKDNPYQQGVYPFYDMEDCNYNHYCLQLNLYKYLLEKKYSILIETMNLVCLYPTRSTFLVEKVPDLQLKIEKMLHFFQSSHREEMQDCQEKEC